MEVTYEKETTIHLRRITWPIFIEILLFMLLGNVDTMMLSRFSDGAVAAVGVSNQILGMIQIMFGIVASGTAILVAQYLGAKQKEMAYKVVLVSILLNTVFGFLLSGVVLLIGKRWLMLMNLPSSHLQYGVSYLSIVGGSLFLQSLLMTYSAVVRSHGLTKLSMMITLGMNIFNLLGDYVFIFGPLGIPVLGVEGVAIATVFSKIIGLFCMGIVVQRNIQFKFSFKKLFPFPKDILKSLLRIGIPSAGEQLSYNLSQLVITYIITLLGAASLTAKIYAQNLLMFTFLFALAIAQGTQILIGHFVGQGKKEKAYRMCLQSLRTALSVCMTMALLFAVFGTSLMKIFTDNKELITLGASILIVDLFLEPGRIVNLVVIQALRAAGDVKYPVYMGVISMWGVSVTLSYLLGITLHLGLIGVWIAFTLDEWIRALLMLVRWKNRKWQQMDFISLSAESPKVHDELHPVK